MPRRIESTPGASDAQIAAASEEERQSNGKIGRQRKGRESERGNGD
jgi:hypothetical protein